MDKRAISGKKIEARRKTLKLSRNALAKRIGVSRNSVYNWESGGDEPSKKYYQLISDALDIDITELITEDEDICGPDPAQPYNKDTAAHLPAGDAQKINIEEAMGKTYKVLTSGTSYAMALYLNVQQFSNAVDAAKELHVCQESIADLQAQVNDLRRQVDRLTAPPTTAAQQEVG